MSTLEHGHTPEEIRRRLSAGARPSYLRDWVYGGIDGTVTTFAVVAGVVGADLSSRVILLLGAANLIGDGFSMAAANYSGAKAEQENVERVRRMEARHIDLEPEGEREEIRQIFASKGFSGEGLDHAVEVTTSSRRRWIETMLTEEHGLSVTRHNPLTAALWTFGAFIVCGLVPLLPYIFAAEASLLLASAFSGLVFFGIGSMKSIWSPRSWWYSGLETLAIGACAAGLAYAVGRLLKTLI